MPAEPRIGPSASDPQTSARCEREGIASGKQATQRKECGSISAGRSRLAFFSDSKEILQQFFSVGCQDPAVVTGGAV